MSTVTMTPPPVADLFRTDRGEDIRDLAARAAEAELRAQSKVSSSESPAPAPQR